MSRKYKFKEKDGAYFISFATVFWIDLFTRMEYFDIVIASLDYCRKNKGMEIFGYCIMPSHIHLIFRSSLGDPSGLMRDFKGFTSRKMLKAIAENPQESRKEWLLEKFITKDSSRFWGTDNHPIELWSNKVIDQKLDYLPPLPPIYNRWLARQEQEK